MRIAVLPGFPEPSDRDRAVADRLKQPIEGAFRVEGENIEREVERLSAAIGDVRVRVDPDVKFYFIARKTDFRDAPAIGVLNHIEQKSGLTWYIENGEVVLSYGRPTAPIKRGAIAELLRRHVPCDPSTLPEAVLADIRRAVRRLTDDDAASRDQAVVTLRALQEREATTNSVLRQSLAGTTDPDLRLRLQRLLDEDPRLPVYRP